MKNLKMRIWAIRFLVACKLDALKRAIAVGKLVYKNEYNGTAFVEIMKHYSDKMNPAAYQALTRYNWDMKAKTESTEFNIEKGTITQTWRMK